ncbi:hypothetical protein [Nonomuraea salmonea]
MAPIEPPTRNTRSTPFSLASLRARAIVVSSGSMVESLTYSRTR